MFFFGKKKAEPDRTKEEAAPKADKDGLFENWILYRTKKKKRRFSMRLVPVIFRQMKKIRQFIIMNRVWKKTGSWEKPIPIF